MKRKGRHAREPRTEPALPQSDVRHGFASTVAGLGVYGLLLLCLIVLA